MATAVKPAIRALRRLLNYIDASPDYDKDPNRSEYERFATPFTFKPRLSVIEAILEVFASFFRIVLGCLLFAVWGTYSILAWFNVPNLFLRFLALLALLLAFLAALAILMVVIATIVRFVVRLKTIPL